MSDDSTTTSDDAAEATERQELQEREQRAAALRSEASALFGVAPVQEEQVTEPAAAEALPFTETAGTTVAEPPGEITLEAAPQAEDEDEDEAEADEPADAATGQEAEQEVEEGDVPPSPAAASYSFGLVFQAPDLSDLPQRRSRRAVAGVTTPAELPAELEAPEDADADASEGDTGPAGDDDGSPRNGRRRRRGGKGRRGRGQGEADNGNDGAEDDADQEPAEEPAGEDDTDEEPGPTGGTRRRSRSRSRSRGTGARDGEAQEDRPEADDTDARGGEDETGGEESDGTRRRRRRRRSGESGATERTARDEVTSVRGSTRLEAKRQRRREGREAGRRRTVITEAEFLARRESVDRVMVVRGLEDRTQIAVLEDGVPVEHYVSRSAQTTMAGNVYLGRVQNVLPSMEAAFVDIGKGRNAVLYAGEVNWDAAGLDGEPRRIENALKSGESVLVQVTKDPIGHKGARLTSQISLPGRFLVYVPGNSMTGISRKLPDTERARLKKILKEVVPAEAGVIVRTAAEGASEAELRADVERLTATWERIQAKATTANAPALLHGEPDMTVRVIRDVFTEDFSKLVVAGQQAWSEVKRYIDDVAPDLADRVEKYTGTQDIFTAYRVQEAIAKAMDRKVWLPSGGSLVIDRTEAMTVVDVNTGKFTGSGGNLEETVTKNNIEAAEEIVRQLRLRDIGGIIVIDFIDMVLESNRDLVVRRLLECLGRDRTKHQVAEVTSLGLVQMTRKRVGSGLIEVFSDNCPHCSGRGIVVHAEPTTGGSAGSSSGGNGGGSEGSSGSKRGRGQGRGRGTSGGNGSGTAASEPKNVLPPPNPNGPTPAQIAAAAHAAALNAGATSEVVSAPVPADEVVDEETTATHAGPRSRADAQEKVAQQVAEAVATEPATESAAPVVTPEPAHTPEPALTHEPEPAAEPAPAPKRRRRGRASAPAGPPVGVEAVATD